MSPKTRLGIMMFLQFFIWGEDELTSRMADLLIERIDAGVEVRATYDWWGSLNLGKRDIKRMMKAGAHVEADLARLRHVNYRNHRKIVVIDGEVAYTGGMMGVAAVPGSGKTYTLSNLAARLVADGGFLHAAPGGLTAPRSVRHEAAVHVDANFPGADANRRVDVVRGR